MSNDQLKVVQDNPEAVKRRRFWSAFVALLCLTLAYAIGVFEGQVKKYSAESLLSTTQLELLSIQSELKKLRQLLSIAEKRSEIDRLATDNMRKKIAALRAEMAQQQEDITFYQQVMSGKKTQQRLKVDKVVIQPNLESNRYRYQLVLTQVGKRHPWVKGKADVAVVGLLKGKKASYSLKQLNDTLNNEWLPFKFRYFQKLEGELQIPAGFQPEYVQVRLTSEGRSSQVVEGQFSWNAIKGV